MARTDARRLTNLILIMVMVVVVIIGISLQTRSIGSRSQRPPAEATAPAPEEVTDHQLQRPAQEPAPKTELSTGDELSAALWKVIMYGVLIVAAILIGARVVKRYGGERLKQASSPEIRLLGRRYISPKQSVVIVKVRHKELLLGITDHSIRLLYDFTSEEEGNGTEFA